MVQRFFDIAESYDHQRSKVHNVLPRAVLLKMSRLFAFETGADFVCETQHSATFVTEKVHQLVESAVIAVVALPSQKLEFWIVEWLIQQRQLSVAQ